MNEHAITIWRGKCSHEPFMLELYNKCDHHIVCLFEERPQYIFEATKLFCGMRIVTIIMQTFWEGLMH